MSVTPMEPRRGRGRPGGEADPWATSNPSGYDVGKFYTRSTNEHDHSHMLNQVRIPPHLWNLMSEAIADKRLPHYRSWADVIRDALVHRLHYIAELTADRKLAEAVTMEMMVAEAERVQAEMAASKQLVGVWSATLEQVTEARMVDQLDALLDTVEFYTERLTPPFDREMRELYERYRRRAKELRGE